MLYPVAKDLAPLLLASYTPMPFSCARAQIGASVLAAVPAPAATAPPTNTAPAPAAAPVTNSPAAASPVTNAPPSSALTNAAPAGTQTGTARPVSVEASVIVLLYHQFVAPGVHIPPKLQWTINQDVFETEMKYLHDNGYHVIPMSDLLKYLKHEIGLPPNSVVITIDDGYKSAIVYAAPILKKYGFPWTFFVYPDFITPTESKGAASWPDLLALQADGVDIESHSMTHPMLTNHHQKVKGVWHNFSPEEYDQWLTNETAGAKTLLEQKMGKPIICFAYPYGAYNKAVEAKTIAAGYEAIFTVADNPVRSSGATPSPSRSSRISTPIFARGRWASRKWIRLPAPLSPIPGPSSP
jgi:peptidoglycan/xylan/chitin deacetylase (PgdA/CDA1 family)